MTGINRKQPPRVHRVDRIEPLNPLTFNLSNGIPVYCIEGESEGLVRTEVVFSIGHWAGKWPLTGAFTYLMLQEGTLHHSPAEIAEILNYHGATLTADVRANHCFVTLLCMTKHLPALLALLSEIIREPSFPVNELEVIRNQQLQTFLTQQKKVRTIADNHFRQALFGNDHPNGYITTAADYAAIQPEYLFEFHKNYCAVSNCTIIVSGDAGPEIAGLLNRHFSEVTWTSTMAAAFSPPPPVPGRQQKQFIRKKDAVQNAIFTGRLLFNRHHPDYIPMSVLNTVLGGYFGSRLMKNLREDKGYTYGASSQLRDLSNTGYLVISTETGSQYTSAALKEIYSEIHTLRNKRIDSNELDNVVSYLSGNMLELFDGPFASADTCRMLMAAKLPFNYYSRYLQAIHTITPETLIEMARRYLNPEDFYEVVAGT